MLRRDPKARFLWRLEGFLRKHKVFKFHAGGYQSQADYTEEQVDAISARSSSNPYAIMRIQGTRRQYWVFAGTVYWEEEGLQAEDVRALVLAREQTKQWKLERAKQIVSQGAGQQRSTARQIPVNVQQFVWQRDGGRCVSCGRQDSLEFDHIIPVARGGSSSERNIQLLCRNCNCLKRDRIG